VPAAVSGRYRLSMAAESDEVERLRARVHELEDQLASGAPEDRGTSPTGSRWSGVWRRVGATVCLVLAFVLAPLSVVAQWAHDEVGDTERYVATVGPLASDPAVQAALTDRITQEILNAINLDELTDEALSALAQQSFIPDRAAAVLPSLSVPLSGAISDYVHGKVAQVVASPSFEKAWEEANRAAHEQMVAVLTGNTDGKVEVTENSVRINIAAFVAAAKQLMLDEGFGFAERIPDINATFTVFQSADIGRAQRAFALLDTLARVLPVLVLLLVFVGVWLAPDRRKAWIAAGLTIAASMLVLGLALNLIRPVYLDAVPADVLPVGAAASIYDTLTHFLRQALRAVLVVSLAIAAAALLMASSGPGAGIRRGLSSGLSRLGDSARGAGMDTGPLGRFLGTYRTVVRITIVAVGALLYLAVDHPTAVTAAAMIAGIILLLVLLELIAVKPEEPTDQTDEQPPVEHVSSS
jgi:hypothetical protein